MVLSIPCLKVWNNSSQIYHFGSHLFLSSLAHTFFFRLVSFIESNLHRVFLNFLLNLNFSSPMVLVQRVLNKIYGKIMVRGGFIFGLFLNELFLCIMEIMFAPKLNLRSQSNTCFWTRSNTFLHQKWISLVDWTS